MQTQVWLLLKKQSDQGLHFLLFSQAFCEIQPWKPTFSWEQKEKSVQTFRTLTVIPFQLNNLTVTLGSDVAPFTQVTHKRNKNRNIQGRSLNVIKVIFYTIMSCS